MKQKDATITINVKELKKAFREAFPGDKVTELNGPWSYFWAVVARRGTVTYSPFTTQVNPPPAEEAPGDLPIPEPIIKS